MSFTFIYLFVHGTMCLRYVVHVCTAVIQVYKDLELVTFCVHVHLSTGNTEGTHTYMNVKHVCGVTCNVYM